MAKRVLNVELKYKSVMDAVNYLNRYSTTWVEQKTELLVRRLAQIGLQKVEENNHPDGDSQPGYATYRISSAGNTAKAIITYEGKDVMFIEFGAGVHYNTAAGTSPHPDGDAFGYTIGSYGHGLGKNDSWMYVDDSGVLQRSYGTKAAMPMYHAWDYLHTNIVSIAKEVFK